MPQRIFLGYDSPFLSKLVDHLLADLDSLPHTLIIVPTSQSGRTLREALANKASAILAPTLSTPGALLHIDSPDIAPNWVEKLSFIETLESISESDWPSYQALLPPQPPTTSDWSNALATEITKLRHSLQEHLLDLSDASRLLKNTPESERWDALARLEFLALKKLSSWGYTSRTTALRTEFKLPTSFKQIILVGITELPPCLARLLESSTTSVISIIPAPESEEAHFSSLGLPLPSWADRPLPPRAKLSLHANPSDQAAATLQTIADLSCPSDQFAIGSPDEQTATALSRALSENGWPAFHPAAKPHLPPITRWLIAWKNWITKPDSKQLASLLTLPEASRFIQGSRALLLQKINKIRDRNPTISPSDLLIHTNNDSSSQVHQAIKTLLELREIFLKKNFPTALSDHLQAIPPDEITSFIQDFLTQPVLQKIKRPQGFWLNILLSEIPTTPHQPPADRVLDIQGWLELLFESAPHLIIAGMNDAFVPAKSGGEPWLSETIRNTLRISTDIDRHARDNFLLHAMIHMRANSGSTHLLCGKTGNTGEIHIPSRLLLQTPRENLIPTVRKLFREIEPPETNLAWSREWHWNTPSAELPDKLRVTSLRDYLSCPFRFYLKNILNASASEPDRREMNQRDFGNMTHKILQIWGENPEATTITDPEKLTTCLHSILEELIPQNFGKNPTLAIRIQTRSLRQRLEWFARLQAQIASDGWEILHIEHKISIHSPPFTINGQIDRIDQNRHTGQIRVIDYKTGAIKNIEAEHRINIKDISKLPTHISENDPPFSKSDQSLWTNLQIPLYALAMQKSTSDATPIPTYITLGKTQKEISLQPWDSFSEKDIQSARECLDWICSQIKNRIFWPPAEKSKYDDFASLSPSLSLSESFSPPPAN